MDRRTCWHENQYLLAVLEQPSHSRCQTLFVLKLRSKYRDNLLLVTWLFPADVHWEENAEVASRYFGQTKERVAVCDRTLEFVGDRRDYWSDPSLGEGVGPIGSRVMNAGHGASSYIRREREGYKSHYLYDYCEYCGRKFIFTMLSILRKKLKTSPQPRFDAYNPLSFLSTGYNLNDYVFGLFLA